MVDFCNRRCYSKPQMEMTELLVRDMNGAVGGARKGDPLRRQINVAALFSALDSKREAENLSWREVAREVGVNHSIFTRLSQGNRPDVDTFMTLTGWLGLSPDRFVE